MRRLPECRLLGTVEAAAAGEAVVAGSARVAYIHLLELVAREVAESAVARAATVEVTVVGEVAGELEAALEVVEASQMLVRAVEVVGAQVVATVAGTEVGLVQVDRMGVVDCTH